MKRSDKEELRAIFEPDGALSKALPGYEFRDSQVEMALTVWRAFSTSRCALIESGTGTGKSVAYLVPAILWAGHSGEKVVISTNTINLQEQLIHRDLPALSRALDIKFRYTLVKGRSNYVCRRKLAFVQDDMDEAEEAVSRAAFAGLLSELAGAATGSKSDFETEVPAAIWEKVASDSMSCLRSRCPYLTSCYFQKARSEMEAADVLVTNHHLLFSDLALRRAMPEAPGSRVLPDYRYVVFDEAHNVPGVAAEHLSHSASLARFRRVCQDLVRVDVQRRSEGGLLPRLRAGVFRDIAGRNAGDLTVVARHVDAAMEATRRLREASGAFFDSLKKVMREAGSERGEGAVRLREEITAAPVWQQDVLPTAERLQGRAVELETELGRILERLGLFEEDLGEAMMSSCAELQGIVSRLSSERHALDYVMAQPDKTYVYWSQASPEDIEVVATPLDVAPLLREHLFEAVDSAVLTSATIAVQSEFDFFKREVGLTGLAEPPLESVFGSPFDFPQQALLAVPLDLPGPQNPGFVGKASRAIMDIVLASRGRAFVLFTSIAMMCQVEQAIRPGLDAAGIRLFKQGDLPRHRMLTLFRGEPGVLLGADSFWQGVDVPGEALSCVILVRLPFQVPTDPVVEAKTEAAGLECGNGFYSYALPCAVIRFRQGFGRLIRSREDRGVVVVLDRRLVEKPYGRAFLSSLPPVTFLAGTTDEVVGAVRRWLD